MMVNELKWHRALPGKWIRPNEVHVWRASLDLTSLQIGSLFGILSTDEVERAGRFRFERDQKRFIAARGMLRQILGRYLGKNPQELRFEYTSKGKPVLATDSGCDALGFNLSHSDSCVLYAVTPGRNIGVDIERIRDDIAVGQIARRFFSKGEMSSLEKIGENKRHELFFLYWTRKEAFLKATGEGISFPMEQLDVSFANGRVSLPVTLPGDKMENLHWYVQDLFPGRGYAAAIAVEGENYNLSCRRYSV